MVTNGHLGLDEEEFDPRHFKNGFDQLSYVSGIIVNIHEDESQIEFQRTISKGSSRVSFFYRRTVREVSRGLSGGSRQSGHHRRTVRKFKIRFHKFSEKLTE